MNKNKYIKIKKLLDKTNVSNFESVQNYGLYSGDKNFFKILKIYETIKLIGKVKGDIIEFGTWDGNTGILIAKILKLLKIKKKIYLLDSFLGLKDLSKEDKSRKIFNLYQGNLSRLRDIINFFKLDNVEIIKKDVNKLKIDYFKKFCFSLIILDLGLYLPTKNALTLTKDHLSKRGIFLFDQGNQQEVIGDKKALDEFLKKHKKEYTKKIFAKYPYQPDVMLIKKY